MLKKYYKWLRYFFSFSAIHVFYIEDADNKVNAEQKKIKWEERICDVEK